MSVPHHALPEARAEAPRIAVALLGTGAVGSELLSQLAKRRPEGLRLVAAANSSRQWTDPNGLDAGFVQQNLQRRDAGRAPAQLLEALDATGARHRVIIDATASNEVAHQHPFWLARGYHVVTANKALNGGSLDDWHAIDTATTHGNTRYAASATVGAGLPVIDTLRRWQISGDQTTRIEGVFSGSLSWLFNRYDGNQPFSELLFEARRLGYSEPDPRADLSGTDVARKLLILARNAGIALDPSQVRVENLVPTKLRDVPLADFEAGIDLLDRQLAERHATAQANHQVLRHTARFDRHGAHVGLVAIDADAPAASLQGSDNLFVLSSASYDEQPIIIRGPGAGTTVTAQALLADMLQLAA